VNLFVGGECVRFAEGLETPIADGCEIAILPAVSGG
jgi:molybdopterin converting factor small subunit